MAEALSPYDELLELARNIRVRKQAGWQFDGDDTVNIVCTIDELLSMFPTAPMGWKIRALDAARALAAEMGAREEEMKWRSGV